MKKKHSQISRREREWKKTLSKVGNGNQRLSFSGIDGKGNTCSPQSTLMLFFLRFLRVCLQTSRFTSLTISSKLQRLFFLVLNYGEKMKSIYYEASIVFHRKVVCAGWLDWSCRQVSGGDSHYSTCAPPDSSSPYLLASCLTESSASVPLRLSQGPRPLLQALSMWDCTAGCSENRQVIDMKNFL